MRADEFDYELPPAAIAQHPIEPRDAARLLVAGPGPGAAGVEHRTVAELDRILRPGDTLVVNDTRVLAARLHLRKPTGGAVELLLLEPAPEPGHWHALVRPGRRVAPGTVLELDGRPTATVKGRVDDGAGDGRRLVEIDYDAVADVGEVPLPPYINETLDDPDRYQTVFADRLGSVAAPTAGLHLTEALIDRLATAGIAVERVELRVGLGTFKPITADVVDDHQMHHERYAVRPDVWERISTADRVVAVGTTVVRTLESVAATGHLEGDTDLFIRRGFDWRVVDVLMTNFHVPRSSLLVLVDALVGPRWRDLYRVALAEGYRFLSFGDAMLLERTPTAPAGPGAESGIMGR